MKFRLTLISIAAAGFFIAAGQQSEAQTDDRFHGSIVENFNSTTSDYFNCHGRYNFRYFPNMPSLSEKGTDVMIMRIDPKDPAGAGRGPEIGSKKYTHFGTYTARIRVPDVKKAQPDIGVVVGYFTYRMDGDFGLSEIDFEWLIADPTLIYIGTWTGPSSNLQRVGRTIDLDAGRILYTNYRNETEDESKKIEGNFTNAEQLQPQTIEAIEGYDASKRFYVYGFDWLPDRLTWWIQHPTTNEKIILWDYVGTEIFDFAPCSTGIPQSPTSYLLNFWHTNNWPVDTNPASTEAPAYPYSLEVDWMRYEPFTEESSAWVEDKNW